MSERLYTTGEIANLFRVHPKTVVRWAQQGRLPCFLTPGGHRRFRDADVQKMLDNGTQPRTR